MQRIPRMIPFTFTSNMLTTLLLLLILALFTTQVCRAMQHEIVYSQFTVTGGSYTYTSQNFQLGGNQFYYFPGVSQILQSVRIATYFASDRGGGASFTGAYYYIQFTVNHVNIAPNITASVIAYKQVCPLCCYSSFALFNTQSRL